MTQIKDAGERKLVAESIAAQLVDELEGHKKEVRCSESCSLLHPLLLLAKFPPAT